MKRHLVIIACIILMLTISISPPAMANHPDGGEFTVGTGGTLINISIMPTVYDYATEYKVYTNESNLVDALLGIKLIEGEDVSWGFNITAVDGREVDYTQGGYWHIYRDNVLEALTDPVPIQADDQFFMTLSALWEEDEEGNALMAANDLNLPWPENWPDEVPRLEGRIVAYFGGDSPESPLGMGLGLAVSGWEEQEPIQAYVERAVSLGYEVVKDEINSNFRLASISGKGYEITLSQDVECMIHVRKLLELPDAAASAGEIPENLLPEDPRLEGLVTEALPLEDGLLLLGESEYGNMGWMARVGEDGGARWVLEEEDGGVFRSVRALPDGSFTALIVREPDFRDGAGEYAAMLASLTSKGKLARTRKLSDHTRRILPLKDGYFALGTYYPQQGDVTGAQVTVARLDLKGERKWSARLPASPYSGMVFRQAALAGDALYIAGEGFLTDGNRAGLLLRLDLRGNVRWTREIRLGEDTYTGGLALTPQGLIALSATGWKYEEDGPGTRRGAVLGYSTQGDALWEHPLEDSRSADYVLSAAQGILVGSRGLDLESCPLLGEGWLLLLDGDGHPVEASLPDIGGGKLELMGLAMGVDGAPLLLGATIFWPQAVDTAYAARLELVGAQGD